MKKSIFWLFLSLILINISYWNDNSSLNTKEDSQTDWVYSVFENKWDKIISITSNDWLQVFPNWVVSFKDIKKNIYETIKPYIY